MCLSCHIEEIDMISWNEKARKAWQGMRATSSFDDKLGFPCIPLHEGSLPLKEGPIGEHDQLIDGQIPYYLK